MDNVKFVILLHLFLNVVFLLYISVVTDDKSIDLRGGGQQKSEKGKYIYIIIR